MRGFRLLVAGSAVVMALMMAAAAALYASDPWLWTRFGTALQALDIANVDWRRPAEAVPGGSARLLRAESDGADTAAIELAAIEAAAAYAEATGSHALLIHHRGALVFEQYWNGHDANTRFDTASMHKSVLTILLGIAIDEAAVGSIDDPVGLYITEWAGDARGEITLRQLASMSSGLRLEPLRPNPFRPGLRLMIGGDIESVALALPMADSAATAFEYSNFNAQILGIALMRAIGPLRYAEYLSSRLWQPLGAADAAVWLDREEGMARSFCCLLATAPAWMQLGKLVLQQGRVGDRPVVSAGWIAEMLSPSMLNPNYGLNIWIGAPESGLRRYNSASSLRVVHGEPYLADDVVFFDGMGGQRVYIVPSAELVIVRIGESDPDWDDAVLPNTLLRGLQAALPAGS